MGTVASALAQATQTVTHTGKCCVVTRFLRGDLDDEDRAAIRDMLAGGMSARATSEAFVRVGLYISALQVTRHRLGQCRCCEVHGG